MGSDRTSLERQLAPRGQYALSWATPPPNDQHPVIVYITSLGSEHSRKMLLRALDKIAGLLDHRCDALTLDWPQVRYQHSQVVRTMLAAKYAPATVNQHLAALRGVLRECWRLGQMDAETYHRAADVKAVRGERLPAGRHVESGELRALFASCAEEKKPIGVRDAALMAVLYGAGLRRAEAAALDLADYDVETDALTVRRGKGNKQRLVYATNGAKEALGAWLVIRGEEPGPLFMPLTKGQKVTGRRMTAEAIRWALKARAKKANVAEFSPHDLRRTYIGDLLEAGADIATVQRLAGHANVTTTARYDRRGEATKRRAAEMLHVPFAG